MLSVCNDWIVRLLDASPRCYRDRAEWHRRLLNMTEWHWRPPNMAQWHWRQNGRHFEDNIFKCIFVNENVWIPLEISLNFLSKDPITNIPALVQIMAWRRPRFDDLEIIMNRIWMKTTTVFRKHIWHRHLQNPQFSNLNKENDKYAIVSIQENELEIAVCTFEAILCRPKCICYSYYVEASA